MTSGILPGKVPISSEHHSSAILGVCLSTIIVAVFCVSLRIYVRVRLTHSFWWDDGIIAAALALSITGTAFAVICVRQGAGQHLLNLPDPHVQVSQVVKWNTAYQIDNVLCVNLVKVSILLFVLRIQNSRKVAHLIWVVMFTMSVVNIVTVAMLASQCQPLARLWNPSIPGTCFKRNKISTIGYAQGVVNILTDFFCTITPIIVLWKVQISIRRKVLICGLMSLGLMATASQIVRIITLKTLLGNDYPYQITAIFISALLDQNLGIIAACIPTFQPLFRSFAKTIRSVGNNKDRRLESSYRKIPDKGGKTRNIEPDHHASQSASQSRTSTITTAFASHPLTDVSNLESDFALHGLKPIQEDRAITYKKTSDVKYGARADS